MLSSGLVSQASAFLDGAIHQDAGRENILTSEAAQAVMVLFAATNRIPWSAPMFLKLYFAGYVRFHNTEKSQAWTVSYIPGYDAATYGEYYFRLKGTNDLRNLFQLPRTNKTDVALPP